MGLGRKTREEQLEDAYDQFLRDMEDSELPSYMINYYGMPVLPSEDISEGGTEKESSTT